MTRGRVIADRAIGWGGRVLRASPPGVRRLMYGAARRTAGALKPVVTAPGPLPPPWISPPVPTPPHVTLEDLEDCWRSWSVNHEPVGHLDAYRADSSHRFCHTWSLARGLTGDCLELGANPYFATYLLDEHTDLRLTLSNFYGERGESIETVSFLGPNESARRTVERPCRLFNIEQETFPFETASFDVVLFCEILEHMLMDPLSVLREIHRVLRRGGALILTTPNVARLDNVLRLVRGDNIYDPYSGFGPYGRHNREYNRHELHRLLEFAGFDVEVSFTADGHAMDLSGEPGYDDVARLVRWRSPDLGTYVFVRAVIARPPRSGRPTSFYRSWPPMDLVEY